MTADAEGWICGLAIHWQYAVGVVDRSEPILVPVWTFG